jgi:hypothetical protein
MNEMQGGYTAEITPLFIAYKSDCIMEVMKQQEQINQLCAEIT